MPNRASEHHSRASADTKLAPWWPLAALGALVLVLIGSAGGARAEPVVAAAGSAAHWCRPDTSAPELDRLFDGDPGGIVGADYPRTLPLPDGRILWTFQDPVVSTPDGRIRNLHNAAVVQEDNGFTLLRSGTAADPGPWLLADLTITEREWFWPLHAALGPDDRVIHVFLAQMFEQSATGYLTRSVPNSVVVMTLDAVTLEVVSGPVTPSWGRLTERDPTLYGWSVETAGAWTYLLGHCHRQFGFDPFLDTFAHDRDCAREVRLARAPRGRVLGPLQYWTGATWTSDRNAARPLFDAAGTTFSHPTQLQWVNGRWMATTKLDDWFGDRIVVHQADHVVGPWQQTGSYAAVPKTDGECATDPFGCATYFSSFIDQPGRAPTDPVVISLSHNLWTGRPTAQYRPTFLTIPPPPHRAAPADRCSRGHC